MKPFDLDEKLKSVPLPEQSEEYWDNFPAQVRRQLGRAPRAEPLRENAFPQFAWRLAAGVAGFAVALAIFSQPLSAASQAIAKKENFIRQQLAAIPKNLQVFMAAEHGLHHLIAEAD